MTRLRVGVIGLGKMGLLHSSILNTFDDVELVALCEKNLIIRKAFERILKNVSIVKDLNKLQRFDLDAVFVTTPIPSHFQIIKSIYTDGVADNVFVEKTLASTYDQCVELSQLAYDYKSVNMVGYMERFAVTFSKAKELLNQTIGEPVSFDASAYSSDFFDVEKGVTATASRGGALRDLGSHVIDLALWYFGDMKVNSATLKPLLRLGHDNSAELKVETANGSPGRFDVSWCRNDYRMPEFMISVKGTQGSLRATNDELRLQINSGQSSVWYRQDLDDSVRFLLGGPEYSREDEYFLRSIRNSRDASPDFLTSSKVDLLIDEAERAAGKDG